MRKRIKDEPPAISMQTYIKGTIPKDLVNYNDFAEERKAILLSMNEYKIRRMYRKYGMAFPPENETFWEAVAKSILKMPEAPEDKVREAKTILNELNVEE